MSRIILAAFLLIVSETATAQVANLDAGLPTEIEDTTPTPAGATELHLPLRYERDRDGHGMVLIEPRLQRGWEGGWQSSISIPVIAGSGDKTGRGDLKLDLFKTLVRETATRPSIAAALGIELPTGTASAGLDSSYKVIVSRTLASKDQVHANFVIEDNAAPTIAERGVRWRLLAGYSRQLSARSALVADVIREQTRLRGGLATLVEAGMRHQLEQDLAVSLGGGIGFGDDSPRWRVMAGIQKLF